MSVEFLIIRVIDSDQKLIDDREQLDIDTVQLKSVFNFQLNFYIGQKYKNSERNLGHVCLASHNPLEQ